MCGLLSLVFGKMTLEVDRIAQEAFRTQNYEVAVECFNELLSEHGPKTDWLLGKADALARSGRINDAFSVYAHAFRLGEVKEEQLQHLVFSLIETTSKKEQTTVQQSSNHEQTKPFDMFTCSVCNSLLQEPATISCGHTFCKPCIPAQVLRVCPICKTKHSMTGPTSGIRCDVLLCSVLKQYFPKEVQANELRKEGNRQFKAGQYREALTKYTQAKHLDPFNPLVASNLSHVNISLERYHEALKDAEHVCHLRPDWPKGYYRKGTALESLGRLEEALKAYLHCLMLDNTLTAARNSLAKVLRTLLAPVQASAVQFGNIASDVKPIGMQALPAVMTVPEVVEMFRPLSGDSGADSDCSGGGLWCYMSRRNNCNKSKRDVSSDRKQGCTCRLSAPDAKPRCSKSKRLSSRLEERKRRRSQRGPLSPTRESDFKVFCSEKKVKCREIDPSLVKADDYECSLCMRLLYNPVTTPCGHTFCKECLYRSLDHSKMCPLCKDSLADALDGSWLHDVLLNSTRQFLAERRQTITVLTDAIIQKYLPEEHREREELQRQELEQLARYKTGIGECEIPVFVCTMAFPSIPCPLHVYEPRYRLMVRQCMKSGTKEFGMCPSAEDETKAFADFGCMLEIEDVKHLPDGRSIIKTHGGRRFKVNSRSMRDGYNTAKVEFIKDDDISDEEFEEVKAMNSSVYQQAVTWYSNLPIFHKTRIADFFGHLPQLDDIQKESSSGPAWMWWMTAVLPVSPQSQLRIVSLTNVKDRLQALKHFITRMNQMGH
ncbi:LON peptidase N-terminal domain and RING finger protein 3-like [Amphiura filiformis]|uniref:LON peptidase N-terminal domain and RING finger protein 3-like n=1 Tax=Amphiura filiformis TaxID=82378 RepID=UPI003B2261E0